MSALINPALKRFLWDIQSMVELTEDPREILLVGADLMARLVATDDWLEPRFAAAAPDGPRLFQLFGDAAERFCVATAVLGPGQALPVLLQPCWQILGVVRGTVTSEARAVSADKATASPGAVRTLSKGAVERRVAKSGEALLLANPSESAEAILIQVYGAEIGASPRYAIAPDGSLRECPFGYANGPDNPAHDIWSIQTIIED